MFIFKNAKYTVSKVSVPQCYSKSKDEFFVDDLSGKNVRVFDNAKDAKTWAQRRCS